MTLSVTAAYTAELARHSRTPIYKVAFASVAQTYSTHKISGGTSLPYMQLPTCTPAQIKPEEGTSTSGSITAFFLDRNNAITALIAAGLFGRVATWYGGFEDITEANYATFFTGIVTGCKQSEDYTGYWITCTDLQTLINKQVCASSSSPLTSGLSAQTFDQYLHYVRVTASTVIPLGDYQWTNLENAATFTTTLNTLLGAPNWSFYLTTVTLYGTTVYLDTTDFLSAGYVKIDDEIIAYTTKNAGNVTGLTRAALGSTIASHGVGAKATELIRHTGNAFDILSALLTNTDKTGLSIPAAQVDTAKLATLKTAIGASNTMDFWFTEAVNARDFIERELMKTLACYLVMTGDGRISVQRFAIPVTAVATITHSNIRRRGFQVTDMPILKWDANFGTIINSVVFMYDYDTKTDEYKTTSPKYSDATSITRYGEYPLVIKSKGFRTSMVGTVSVQVDVADKITTRYADGGAPLVSTSLFLSKELIEPGDIVAVTSDLLPNRTTGVKGITGALFEVINRANVFDVGAVDVELLQTSWSL